MFGDASKDSRIPDIAIQPVDGVMYAKPSASKIAEHGGFSSEDSHVPILVSNPALAASTVSDRVSTMQIAPTILVALGLDPMALQAVKVEGTEPLPSSGLTQ
jgi:arylsulfatase A-like enzyme